MQNKSISIYRMMRMADDMHPNDTRQMTILDEAAELLMNDKKWAFHFFNHDADEEMIDWLAGTFGELSWHFGCLEFLAILKTFLLKYPKDTRLTYFVNIAEENTLDKITNL